MDNNYLDKKEKAYANEVYRFFRKSEKRIANLLIQQDEQKGYTEDLKNLLNKINIELAMLISRRGKDFIIKGISVLSNQFKKETLSVQWRNKYEPAVQYLDNLLNLHKSHTREGSTGKTTYTRILEVVSSGLKQGMTRSEIAKNISKIDPVVFSKSRAENIAVSELRSAYEYGRYRQIQEYIKEGDVYEKKWSTARDDRVRSTHRRNEQDGWIDIDKTFSGTGSLIAPSPPRCRCSVIYQVKD